MHQGAFPRMPMGMYQNDENRDNNQQNATSDLSQPPPPPPPGPPPPGFGNPYSIPPSQQFGKKNKRK